MLTLYTQASNLICLIIHTASMAAPWLTAYIHFIPWQIFICRPTTRKIIQVTTILQHSGYENL